MEDDEETGVCVIAQNIMELSAKSFNLLNDIKQCSDDNVNENIDMNQLNDHFVIYYEKYPLKPVTFKDISLEWFNVAEPLMIEEHLSSHIVILDFFTYCCINCLHILPDLEALEEKYPMSSSPVTVIGMHSGKFDNERLTHNVADAIKRYRINHPVANDINCKLWSDLGISCWPTLLILGPNGIPLFVLMGEGHRDFLFMIVDESIKYFSNIGKLKPKPLPLMPSLYLPTIDSLLYYPGKVSSYANGLLISDSGNNRIILTNYDGNIKNVIGCGKKGFKDGPFDVACFSNPQGVAYHPSNCIFVADTENHAIRKIDLELNIVSTVAGNGEQNTGDINGGNLFTNQALSSPWDLCFAQSLDLVGTEKFSNLLLIAMAGSHQIWGLFLTDGNWLKNSHYIKGRVVCLAGSGLEENRNTSYPLKAGFAQPSGICVSSSSIGQIIYIADSESSSIRQFSLVDGAVRKVAGGGLDPKDLFAYGDSEGVGNVARFQHPLGVTCSGDIVYVADSYNHKIKVIKKEGKSYVVKTILGGQSSVGGIQHRFNEPGGLCYSKERNSIFIADTNNFCIKEYNIDEQTLSKIEINYVDISDTSNASEDTVDSKDDNFVPVFLPDYKNEMLLKIHFDFPSSVHLTPETKQKFEIIPSNDQITCSLRKGFFDDENKVEIPITICQSPSACENFLLIKTLFYVCRDEGICLIKEVIQKVKFIKGQDNNLNSAFSNEIDIKLRID